MLNHVYRLRRIQQDVCVRALELRQLRHTNGNLRKARRALAHQTIRREPRATCILLDILTESHIHCVMVFGYIAVDVVQTAIPNLHIDLTVEEHTQEFHEGRYHSSSCASLETSQQTKRYNPSCYMPVWGATTLILRLHAPLKYNEVLVAQTIR